MNFPWDTREQDISIAEELLARHFAEGETSPQVYLQEATIVMEGSMEITRADWVVELEEIFEKKYGEQIGDEVTRRVLSALLTNGATVH